MLILSRRCGESIIVDDEVTLTVLSIKGKQVRIGIDAPDHVSVHREEIYQRIKDGLQEQAPAAAGSASNTGTLKPGDNDLSTSANEPQAVADGAASVTISGNAKLN